MALSTIVVLLIGTCLSSAAYTRLDWSDCGSDPAVSVKQIEVTPMPVVLPGPMQLTLHARMGLPLDNIEILLNIKRSTFLLDLPIPCLFNVGSCTYDSSCSGTSVLDTMVNDDWAGIGSSIGSQIRTLLDSLPGLNTTACPIPPTSIDLENYTIDLPAIPSILSFFAEGDYSAQVTAREKVSRKTMLCLNLHLTLHEKEEPCTGIFCG